jgi:hypothetical protein
MDSRFLAGRWEHFVAGTYILKADGGKSAIAGGRLTGKPTPPDGRHGKRGLALARLCDGWSLLSVVSKSLSEKGSDPLEGSPERVSPLFG